MAHDRGERPDPAGRLGQDAGGTEARVAQALTRDPPVDRAFPAETRPHAIPSGGVCLNALLYTAAGVGPHPTVLLLHGLPGHEQNIDLAQAVRRVGWNVLTFHYRGSWGGPGSFSFAHCIADAGAACDWLAGEAAKPGARIAPGALVVIGHSMGGFVAARLAADRPAIAAAALISAADLGSAFGDLPRDRAVAVVDRNVGTGMGLHVLAGTSAQALAAEAASHADAWRLTNFAARLADRPLLLCTSDDGFAPGTDALAHAIGGGAADVTRVHFATDHSYSDHRLGLQRTVLHWLLTVRAGWAFLQWCSARAVGSQPAGIDERGTG